MTALCPEIKPIANGDAAECSRPNGFACPMHLTAPSE
jgi:hypothetical protein